MDKSTSGARTSKKSKSEARKILYARWVAMGGEKISTLHQFVSNYMQDFQTEDAVLKSSGNNGCFGIQDFSKKILLDGLQSLPYASTTSCPLKINRNNIDDLQTEVAKSSVNNDCFGIQDFSKKILLDVLQSLPSASTTTSCPSKTKPPRTSKIKPDMSTPCKSEIKPCLSTPCTPIPPEFKWTRDTSTVQERRELRKWARAEIKKTQDPDERRRLLDWSCFVNQPIIIRYNPPQVSNSYLQRWTISTSNNKDLQRGTRLLTWAPFRARIPALDERKRWSLQEEVTKLFQIAMEGLQREIKQRVLEISYPSRYPDLTQEHRIYAQNSKIEPPHYQCRNALWIWAELIDCISPSDLKEGPKYVGEKIKEKFPKESYDMIEGRPSINELGFVTIELSGKWIAKSIHKMLKDGIDTWAPKLPVERVIVAHPSLGVEGVDLIRMLPIKYTLMSILEYSKVDTTISHPMDGLKSYEWDGVWASELLNKWFPCEERYGEVVTKGRVPFILPKRDFENAYKDIFALWYGLHEHKADWIVCMTPVRKQVYLEMCLAAAKFEGWIPSDRHKAPRTRYCGFQMCITEERLLDEAISHCMAVSKGEAAKLLGYSVEAVLDCVFRYTSLTKSRFDVCRFGARMFDKKGDTFVYLLDIRAQIHRITNDYRKDIYELKKASELILEKGLERELGFRLLKFTEALEESCLSVRPDILCRYLYFLCRSFSDYHSSVCKDGFVVDTSTLLLYEATEVVIEKCFHLLGILPRSSLFGYSMTQLLSGLQFQDVERPIGPIGVNARDPTRNFRFEMVCFRTRPRTTLWLDHEGWLFGRISVSDKKARYWGNFSEIDVTHVALFEHDWRNPIKDLDWDSQIKNLDGSCVYLGDPDSFNLVSFSYFIEICAELYVTNKNECYQLCNHKKEIDLSSFWENSDGVCGQLTINAKHGYTTMYYILLKDAIDTELRVDFITEPDAPARQVRGYLQAYYGDEFLYKCQSESKCKECYMAVLFRAAPSYELKGGYVRLSKSVLAVPTKGSLIIKAYLQDVVSNKVIIDGTCKFKPQLRDCSDDTITGSEGCSLKVQVHWNYSFQYL